MKLWNGRTTKAEPKEEPRDVVYLVKKGDPVRRFRKVWNLGEAGMGVEENEGTPGRYLVLVPGKMGGPVKDSDTWTWEKEHEVDGLTDFEEASL